MCPLLCGVCTSSTTTSATTTTTTVLCGADEYIKDNVCTACEPGTTNDGDSLPGEDTACDTIICTVNQHVDTNVCTDCALGTVRDAGDDATGTNTNCANTPAPTPAPTFAPCAAGEFRSSSDMTDGSASCTECPDGTYNTVGSYATECFAYEACPSGYYRKLIPKDQQQSCTKCAVGTYKSLGSGGEWSDECIDYTICDATDQWFDLNLETTDFVSGTGNQVDRVCYNHADTVCDTDPSVEYEDVEPTPNSARICAQTTECQDLVEFETSPPTATTDRSCLAYVVAECNAPYTFESTTRGPSNDRVCTVTTLCETEHYVSAVPTTTTNTECTAYTVCDSATFISVEAEQSTWVMVQDTLFPAADNVCKARTFCDPVFDDPTLEVSTERQQVCVAYETTEYIMVYPFDFDKEFDEPSVTDNSVKDWQTDNAEDWKDLMKYFAYDSTDAYWEGQRTTNADKLFWANTLLNDFHMKPLDDDGKVYTLDVGTFSAAEAASNPNWETGGKKYTYTVEVYFDITQVLRRERDVQGLKSADRIGKPMIDDFAYIFAGKGKIETKRHNERNAV